MVSQGATNEPGRKVPARAWRSLGGTCRLWLARDGNVRVEWRDGRAIEGSVRPGSFVAPWLTIVRWRPEGAWCDRTVPLLPGMVDAEAFRRLRIVLRFS